VTEGPVVSSTSPPIALNQIGRIELPEQLFAPVLAPPAVVREAISVHLPTWIHERRLERPIPPPILGAGLSAGETEAISLAVEQHARMVPVDEQPGRKLAGALGVQATGTLGVVLAAKQRGFILSVRPLLEASVEVRFFAATALYDYVLRMPVNCVVPSRSRRSAHPPSTASSSYRHATT
jgi:predicted nucleic acid-binding protein